MPNPWVDLPETGPYAHPRDAEVLAACAANFGPVHALHLECLPEPFLGNPRAPVVLLSRNPGFAPRDPEVHREPGFIAASRANLRHEPAEYPFYLLSPDLADTPGAAYWRGKLWHLAERVLQALDLANIEDAWRIVARNVACVEYHGYHSKEYRPLGAELFTQGYGRQLVQAAVERGTEVVVLRSADDWLAAVPMLRGYARLHRLKSAQNVTLTPTNCPYGWVPVVTSILANEGVANFSPQPVDLARTPDPPPREHQDDEDPPDEPNYRNPRETVRLLDILVGDFGFTEHQFSLLHHFGGGATIIGHRNYCEVTAKFTARSNNIIVARRLASCLTTRRGKGSWDEALAKARSEHPFPPRPDGTPWENPC